jgi:predicted permease
VTSRLYRLVLYLYPPGFRRAYGREMEQCVGRMRMAASTRRAFTLRIIADLAGSLVREWCSLFRRSLPASRPRRPRWFSTGEVMKHMLNDIRFAARLLARDPLFTMAAAGTLALGIGANTAMFSLAEATLLRPVSVVKPHDLVTVPWSSSYPDYREYTASTSGAFAGVLATSSGRFNLTIDGASELQNGLYVSGNAFSVLGVNAAAGRTLLPADDAGPGAPVAGVLGYDFWQRRFGGDPGAIGKVIRVNGRPVTIVGVAAKGFRGLSLSSRAAVFVPLTSITQIETGFFARPAVLEHRGLVWLNVVGRLRDEVSIEQAGSMMDTLYRRLHPPGPGQMPEKLTLTPLLTSALGSEDGALRRFVMLLIGVVALTLLIGCANVANLLLARAARRRRELGVRAALGAGRGRIVSQLLVENIVLGAISGVAAIAVADVALRWLGAYQLPGGIDMTNLGLTVNGAAIGITAALSIATALLFGIAPAWRASRADVVSTLRGDSRAIATGSRLRATLVAAQVSLSLVLLAGTGLFLRSLLHAVDIPLGFDVKNAVTISASAGLARYDAGRARAYRASALEQVRTLPGVTAAGWTAIIPTNGVMTTTLDAIDGYSPRKGEALDVHTPQVGPGYFKAVGTRVLAGRTFDEIDVAAPSPVAVINQAAADRYWAGRDPVGGRVQASAKEPWFTVIGVVENTIVRSLNEAPVPFVYFPMEQAMGGFGTPLSATLMVRTSEQPGVILPIVRERLRALDPNVPLYNMNSFEFHVRELVMPQRMGVTLFSFFSLLALSLATVGIYGVASYVAALRRKEIGIRMALGARGQDIGRLVLVQGAIPVAAGIAVGLILALWAARLVSAFMFDVKPWDPLTFTIATAALGTLALLASYLPARRAAGLDPVSALRQE